MKITNFKMNLPTQDFRKINENLTNNGKMERLITGENKPLTTNDIARNSSNPLRVEYRMDYQLQLRVPVKITTYVFIEVLDNEIEIKCISEVSKLFLLVTIPFILASILIFLLNGEGLILPYVQLLIGWFAITAISLFQLRKRVGKIVKEIIQ